MILLDGYEFYIRKNPAIALHRLRKSDSCRTMWIDALCIDQTSMEERNHQVRAMSKIYTQAARVVIWHSDISESSPE